MVKLDATTLALSQVYQLSEDSEITGILLVDESWLFIGGKLLNPNIVGFMYKTSPVLEESDNPWISFTNPTITVVDDTSPVVSDITATEYDSFYTEKEPQNGTQDFSKQSDKIVFGANYPSWVSDFATRQPFTNYYLSSNQTQYTLGINLTCSTSYSPELTYSLTDMDGNPISWITLDKTDQEISNFTGNIADFSTRAQPADNVKAKIITTFEGSTYTSLLNITVYDCQFDNCQECIPKYFFDYTKGGECSKCQMGYSRTSKNECSKITHED